MEFKKDEFEAALNSVANHYGLTNVAVCGTFVNKEGEKKFIGIVCDPSEGKDYSYYMMTITNVGRLWQFAREAMRRIMASFE